MCPARIDSILPASRSTSSSAATIANPAFFATEDYSRYLRDLNEIALREGCAIHACALMTNRSPARDARRHGLRESHDAGARPALRVT